MNEPILSDKLENLFPEVLRDYCHVTGLDQNKLAATTTLEVVEDDEKSYSPYPTLIQHRGRDITLVASCDGYADGWETVFSEVEGIDTETAQRLYLATGIAWVGLVHAALDAEQSRAEQSVFALRRVHAIMRHLQDKRAVEQKLQELEVAGKIEASLHPITPSQEDVLEINRVRYALGMSYLVNNLPIEQRERMNEVFADNFAQYVRRLGTSLITFAEHFGLGKPVEPDVYKQHGLVKAFHSFYFAGIFPMDMSDIMDM